MTADVQQAELDGRCGGPKRQGGGTCTQTAGWGTDHVGSGRCKLHGGATYSHRKHAEADRARQAVVTFGLRRDVGPEQALLEEVQWTAGHVAWLRAQVQQLDPEGLTWGLTEERSSGSTNGTSDEVAKPDVPAAERTYRAGEPVIVKLYREERRHLVDVCRAAAAVGVSERLVRLAEAQGRALVAGLQELLAELELTDVQLGRWQVGLPRMLRRLTAGEIGGEAP